MHVTVIDSGLQSHFGHSYSIAKAAHGELAALGISHGIYAHQSAEPDVCRELGSIPHFTRCLYDHMQPGRLERAQRWIKARAQTRPVDDSPSEKESARLLNADYEADLKRIPEEVWRPGNAALFVGPMQHQLLGIARFLRGRGNAPTGAIVLQMLFLPDWLPWSRPADLGRDLYEQAFRLLGPLIGRSVFFTAEIEPVAAFYREHYGLDLALLPFPQTAAPSQKQTGERIRVGFFGYTKAEKGFHLLPGAFRSCAEARSDIDFTVQVQHHHTEPEVVNAEAELRLVPRVRILDGALSTEDFERECADVDIVAIPYDPSVFGLRNSGIFVEAASAGRPVIASKGTWAARSVEADEAAGVVFAPYGAQALSEAILSACSTLPDLKRKAARTALDFMQRNSVTAFGKTLVSFAESTRR